ncbi:MFS transporter [Kineosporia sp. NBRC 101731]|uniref:MFS transporter n=1 Tax=Kineosporia sp. NBRC 101731 TaxID=3032199 RepID=UPI00249FFF00|nr:MFS transporter [Kineosporia sp. NBRC 101731]GLY32333.1 MFS transporter [Kineosporia sp. NBRC 101731]
MTDTSAGSTTRRIGPVLGLLAFAQLIISIDYNIVYVALPRIGSDLDFSPATLQWVISAYAVAFGGFLLLGGRASDLLGKRRMFVAGLATYAVSSLIGAVAFEPWLLLAGRALQGVGGALLFPATLALIFGTFAEGRERNLALSVWAATGASGMVVGSLLGGLLVEWFGWSAVFSVNVPLAAGALIAAFGLIDPDTPQERRRTFDAPGALTATAGVTLVIVTLVQGPVSGWTSPVVLGSLVAGVLLLVAFTVIEQRSPEPLLPFRLFHNRNLGTGVSVTFLFMATFGTLLYFLTEYFQSVHGYSALRTGLALVPPMIAGFCGSIAGGRLASRFGIRPTITTALLVGAAGIVGMVVFMSPEASYLEILPGLLVLSICQGVVFATMFAAAAVGLPWQDQGIGSGIVSTGQQIGSAVGLAVLVGIANRISGVTEATDAVSAQDLTEGMRTSILIIVAGVLLTAAIALNFRTDLPAGDTTAAPDDTPAQPHEHDSVSGGERPTTVEALDQRARLRNQNDTAAT